MAISHGVPRFSAPVWRCTTGIAFGGLTSDYGLDSHKKISGLSASDSIAIRCEKSRQNQAGGGAKNSTLFAGSRASQLFKRQCKGN